MTTNKNNNENNDIPTLFLVNIDQGFCRILYKTINDSYYCFQEEREGLVFFYRCTDQPWCEPSHQVKLTAKVKVDLPVDCGDSLTKSVRKFIENDENMIGVKKNKK